MKEHSRCLIALTRAHNAQHSIIVASCFGGYGFLDLYINTLLFPDLKLPIFSDFTGLLLISVDGGWSLSVRSSPECMSSRRPEVESSGVHHDLIKNRNHNQFERRASRWSERKPYPVIPYSNRVRFPFKADLIVMVLAQLVE